MPSVLIYSLRIVVWGVKLTFFATYGLFRLCLGLVRLPGRVQSTQRLLGESITCPWCDEENPLASRWRCHSCGGQFLADATAPCKVCGALASYIPCRHCQGSILLRGQR